MKKIFIAAAMATALASCSKNPITGRNQLALVPESQVQAMAVEQYAQFLSQNRVVSSSASKDAEMVRRVGQRIAASVTDFYSKNGLSEELAGFKWEYNLVDSKDVNAWCMPGGKIVVYTGLLPVTQNEAALAVVVGHEVAHALARHGSERMSQGLLQQLGGVALAVAMSNKPAETQNLFMNAYGIGTTYGVMLPFSRKNELEADRLGLVFTAMSGYNPQEAIPLWKRMAALNQGQRPPEFASTHPAEETRIRQLEKMMPEAMKYYNLVPK